MGASGVRTRTAAPPAAPAPVGATSPEARGATGRVAVVLVHGMGEQRPMTTLRGFARAYVAQRETDTMWSVPDRGDTSYELHTYVVPAERGNGPTGGGLPQVDFYEGYWAPELRGTRLAHLTGWARHLLLRSPATLPVRVQWLWWVAVVALLLAAALAAWFLVAMGEDPWWTQALKALGVVAAPAVAAWLSSTLGDAARYLDSRPDNVAARLAVRAAVVGLLETLHTGGRYSRIVVVGHSLGGVIAYDAVRLLWGRRTREWDASGVDDTAVARAAEHLRGATGAAVGQARAAFDAERAALFARLSRPGPAGQSTWLISDLLTIGAPLAYPQLLLTPPGITLADLVAERAVPTCPPVLADAHGGGPTFRYPSSPQAPGRRDRFHHAAVFAAARWTNVYAAGDFVGGPVAPVLGSGVWDVRLGGETGRWTRIPVLSHLGYWSREGGARRIRELLNRAIT